MADETGVPGAPYVGARGPRKTPPRKGKHKIKEQEQATVSELFTEERRNAPSTSHPLESTKKRKRKRVMMGVGWTAALDRMDREGITMADS